MNISNDQNKVEPSEADFVSFQKEDQIKISDFPNSSADDKYISTVSDEAFFEIEDNSRFHYRACYIANKERINSLKLQRYKKSKGQLLPDPEEFNIPLKQAHVLADFVKFLKDADLGNIISGKFKLVDTNAIDQDVFSQLVRLSANSKGKNALKRLYDEGYLNLDIDIFDLIKKGMTAKKVEERLEELNSFEDLIDQKELDEITDVQAALKKIPWIFGPEYVSLDIRDAGENGIPDGRLKRIDKLSDILEVKLPSVKLLNIDASKPSRQYMYSDLSKALGQLTGYLEYYDSEYTTERDDKTGKEILEDRYNKYYKPRGILLIGRRDTAHPKNLRRLLSYFHRIEVLTYDDLLERARNTLENLKSK